MYTYKGGIMPGTITHETITINVSPIFKCWRLVYSIDSKKVFALFETIGYTKTAQGLFASDATDGSLGSITSSQGKQQCLDQIASLGLIYTP